LAKF
jgi:superfamily II DNA or RNA helicase